MKRRALALKHKPKGLHLWWYALVWLLMDRWQPAGWVWGVVGTVCAIVFIVSLMDFFTAEEVELP